MCLTKGHSFCCYSSTLLHWCTCMHTCAYSGTSTNSTTLLLVGRIYARTPQAFLRAESIYSPPPRPQVHLMEHNLHSQLFNLQVFICGELINCGPIYNNESRLSVWLWACWFYSRQILCLLWEGKSDRIFLPLSPHVANLKTIFFPSKFPISASLWRQFSGCPLRPLGALLTTPCWCGFQVESLQFSSSLRL